MTPTTPKLTKKKTAKRGRPTKAGTRLTAEDWLVGAKNILSTQGIEAVRVEPLAKKMKVTKGSFYWHFKDRSALLTAVLNDWRKRATNDVIRRLDSSELTPKERLHGLLRLHKHGASALGGASLEMAIRQWAKSDAIANDALDEVDNHRQNYIAHIYRELGFEADSANSRAFLLYSTMLGVAYMPNIATEEMLAKCEQILLKETPTQQP